MIDESNPAGRLHKILSSARVQADQKKVKEVWSSVLGLKGDNVDVTKAVVELYNLSQEIQSLIKMNKNLNHDLYLSSFKIIDKAFFPLNLGSNWNSVKPHLTEEAITRLQFCAEELSRYYSEESLSKEDLDDIVSKTEELFKTVYNSQLPDTLRLSILEEIEKIRYAVRMYLIKGAKGLKEALQSTIGMAVVNQDEIKKTSERNLEVITRLGDLIDKLDSFTSRALKLKKLLTKPIRYLLETVTNPESSDESDEA
jgi:hypothetical protein